MRNCRVFYHLGSLLGSLLLLIAISLHQFLKRELSSHVKPIFFSLIINLNNIELQIILQQLSNLLEVFIQVSALVQQVVVPELCIQEPTTLLVKLW